MYHDDYLWLEEVEGDKALDWVKSENSKTIQNFEDHEVFKNNYNQCLEILNRKDKIFSVNIEGDLVFNLWQDEKNPLGILRCLSLEDFKKQNLNWKILVDLDEKSKKDNIKWVFHGFLRYKNTNKALIYLSRGGLDAHHCWEFDIEKAAFVEGGFKFPEAKGYAEWINEDLLYYNMAISDDDKNNSGYGRYLKVLERGQELSQAKEIFSISKEDISLYIAPFNYKDKTYVIALKNITFFETRHYIEKDQNFQELELPNRCNLMSNLNEFVFFNLMEDWKEFKANDLISYNILDQSYELVLRPSQTQSIEMTANVKDYLILNLLDNISSTIIKFKRENEEWISEKVPLPELGSITGISTSEETNEMFCNYSSFNSPSTYYYVDVEKNLVTINQQLQSKYPFESYAVKQEFSTSLDGTKIPYFLVHKKDIEYNGKNPTILYGYGGFNISVTPAFNEINAPLWLERGGVLAFANIRGGGEYGAKWHQAALKLNRHKAYEDFFSIAQDLINKKITSRNHLGARGGSNGGLLMGVCYTQRPDLFKAIDCLVPLLDMLRFHKLLAGASWVAEYGSVENEEEKTYLESYSPYQNINRDKIKDTTILLYTSTKDDRVHPGHARKMAAKIKELNLPYFYFENLDGGHGGSSNFSERARQMALEYTFFHQQLT